MKKQWTATVRHRASKKEKTVSVPGGLSEPEAWRHAFIKANGGVISKGWVVTTAVLTTN